MPRRDDDFEDDDDRPRRRRPRDDFDDERTARKKNSSTGLVVGILIAVFVLCCVHRLRRDVSDQTLLWLIDRQDSNVIFENWEHR